MNSTTKKRNILIFALLFVTIIISLVIKIIIPNNKYNHAIYLFESGKLNDAYEILKELGSFKDSIDVCDKINYTLAVDYIESGNIKKAYLALLRNNKYEESINLKLQLEHENPNLKILSSKVGDVVLFGQYEQDGNVENGKENIEWIVLSNENGNIYMLSKYVLDVQEFNKEDTEDCTLDDWLKDEFSKIAFSKLEEDSISRIGLLHKDEIKSYNITLEQRVAEYTPYAMKQNPLYGTTSGYSWWLIESSPLFNSGGTISAPIVWQNGSYARNTLDVLKRTGVRPTIWLFTHAIDLPKEPTFSHGGPSSSSTDSNNSGTTCKGGVSCRAGFRPCSPHKETGYCNKCCKY